MEPDAKELEETITVKNITDKNEVNDNDQKEFDYSTLSTKPLKIKKFRSAYILFCLDFRKMIHQKFPHLSSAQITKILAEDWKKSEPQEKEKYYEREKVEREQFNRQKSYPNVKYSYTTTLKVKRPIRFRTAFMFFMMDHKHLLKNDDKYKNIEMIKSIGKKWKDLSDVDKISYFERAKNDKIRYEKDWDDYLHTHLKIKVSKNMKKTKERAMVNEMLKVCKNDKKFCEKLSSLCQNYLVKNDSKMKKSMNPEEITKAEKRQIFRNKLLFEVKKKSKEQHKIYDNISYSSCEESELEEKVDELKYKRVMGDKEDGDEEDEEEEEEMDLDNQLEENIKEQDDEEQEEICVSKPTRIRKRPVNMKGHK